jgi:hypothetical protein
MNSTQTEETKLIEWITHLTCYHLLEFEMILWIFESTYSVWMISYNYKVELVLQLKVSEVF